MCHTYMTSHGGGGGLAECSMFYGMRGVEMFFVLSTLPLEFSYVMQGSSELLL